MYAKELRHNDLNYEIYTIWRKAEAFRTENETNNSRAKTTNTDMSHLKEDRSEFKKKGAYLNDYFTMNTHDEFIEDHRSFEKNATEAFLALEA